jgi:hypothetical protein
LGRRRSGTECRPRRIHGSALLPCCTSSSSLWRNNDERKAWPRRPHHRTPTRVEPVAFSGGGVTDCEVWGGGGGSIRFRRPSRPSATRGPKRFFSRDRVLPLDCHSPSLIPVSLATRICPISWTPIISPVTRAPYSPSFNSSRLSNADL